MFWVMESLKCPSKETSLEQGCDNARLCLRRGRGRRGVLGCEQAGEEQGAKESVARLKAREGQRAAGGGEMDSRQCRGQNCAGWEQERWASRLSCE